jgi:hypothetical protein
MKRLYGELFYRAGRDSCKIYLFCAVGIELVLCDCYVSAGVMFYCGERNVQYM